MSLNVQQINNLRNSSSADELLEKLNKENIQVSKQEAEKMISAYCLEGQIEDEELENVTGGTCYGSGIPGIWDKEPREHVVVTAGNSCPGWWPENSYAAGADSLKYKPDGSKDLSNAVCCCCTNHYWYGAREYCDVRWRGHEHYNFITNIFEDGEKNWDF